MKAYGANDAADWAGAVAGGWIIPLDLVETLAQPIDDTTGEAFIESVKKAAEIASDISEGHSFNGNSLSGNGGLTLLLKQGIQPVLDVKTLAGAFHRDELAIPAEIRVIPDFGNADGDYYAGAGLSEDTGRHWTDAALRPRMALPAQAVSPDAGRERCYAEYEPERQLLR